VWRSLRMTGGCNGVDDRRPQYGVDEMRPPYGVDDGGRRQGT
jgi:hypothetical protein